MGPDSTTRRRRGSTEIARGGGGGAFSRGERGERKCRFLKKSSTRRVSQKRCRGAIFVLTSVRVFARFPTRCASNGSAHPKGAPRGPRPSRPGSLKRKPLFRANALPSGRHGRARKAAPDSKVSLCWDSQQTRNRNRSAASAATKGLDFNSSESLILAQNERWQRG